MPFESICVRAREPIAPRAAHRFRFGRALIAAMAVCVLPRAAAAQPMEHPEPSADRPEVVVHAFGSVD